MRVWSSGEKAGRRPKDARSVLYLAALVAAQQRMSRATGEYSSGLDAMKLWREGVGPDRTPDGSDMAGAKEARRLIHGAAIELAAVEADLARVRSPHRCAHIHRLALDAARRLAQVVATADRAALDYDDTGFWSLCAEGSRDQFATAQAAMQKATQQAIRLSNQMAARRDAAG